LIYRIEEHLTVVVNSNVSADNRVSLNRVWEYQLSEIPLNNASNVESGIFRVLLIW